MSKVITTPELAQVLENMSGTQFVGVKSCTVPKLNKKGRVTGLTIQETLNINPENIVKISEFVAGAGYSYFQGVINRLLKEGKEPNRYDEGISWHVPYLDTKTIKMHPKTGELYAYFFCSYANNKPTTRFVDKSTGKEISRVDLEEFLPVEKTPMNQGLDKGNEVIVRTFKLSSINELSAAGEVYNIIA